MKDAIRILSIDGGGIRGIIPAMVIQALLGDLKAQDVFHIIAGTSTGGIIACGLAKPDPINLQDIIDLYVKHGGEIFKKGLIDWSHYVYGPRYPSTALEHFLTAELGDTYLSEVKNAELLVPSYAIELPKEQPQGSTCAPMFFRSWQARGLLLGENAKSDEYDFKLDFDRSCYFRGTNVLPSRRYREQGRPIIQHDRRRRVREQSSDVRYRRSLPPVPFDKVHGRLDRNWQRANKRKFRNCFHLGRRTLGSANDVDFYGRQLTDCCRRSRGITRRLSLAIGRISHYSDARRGSSEPTNG